MRNMALFGGGMMLGGLLGNMFGFGAGSFFAEMIGMLFNVMLLAGVFMGARFLIARHNNEAGAFLRSKLWDPAARIDRKIFPSLVCMIGDQVGLDQSTRVAAEERSARAYRDGLWEHIK